MREADQTNSATHHIIAGLAVAAKGAHDRARARWERFPWIKPSVDRYVTIATGHAAVDEDWCVPAVDGLVIRGAERGLAAAGWRFVAAPRFRVRARGCDEPALDWNSRSWLAVPPDGIAEAARTFAKKRDALAWALEINAASGGAA